jgi:hypothetical protein
MNKIALSLLATGLFASNAIGKPALDDAGKCRDNGKFVKQSLCEKPVTKCRDITTKKFAKCDAPNTEPVPESKPPESNSAKPK